MKRHDAGFTLIESLVATAVFALLLAALYQGLAVGWRGLKKSNAEDSATAVLAQLLESSGVETPLQPASMKGTTPDGVTWQTDITPYGEATTSQGNPRTLFHGFWVTVKVRWREGRFGDEHALQATTLKIRKAS